MLKIRVLLAVGLLGVAGCAVNLERQVIVRVVDFTFYRDQGFLFTPEPYQGDYEAIGVITIRINPAVQTKSVRVNAKPYGTAHVATAETVDAQDALAEMYAQASAMGADCVMNLRISVVPYLPAQQVDGLEIAGLAIKRSGAFK